MPPRRVYFFIKGRPRHEDGVTHGGCCGLGPIIVIGEWRLMSDDWRLMTATGGERLANKPLPPKPYPLSPTLLRRLINKAWRIAGDQHFAGLARLHLR